MMGDWTEGNRGESEWYVQVYNSHTMENDGRDEMMEVATGDIADLGRSAGAEAELSADIESI